MNNVLGGLHLALVALGSSAWWEHVESEANPADGGSRDEGVACQLAKRVGVLLSKVDFPPFPASMAAMTPSDWLKHFNSRWQ